MGFPVFLCQIRVSWMLDRQTLPRAAVFSILDVVSHGGKPVHLGVTICDGLKRCANNIDPSTYHYPNDDECKRFHYPYSGGWFFLKYDHLCTPNPCDSTFKSIRKQGSCPVQHQLPWSAFHFLLVGQGFISLNWYKISSIRYSTSDRLSVWDTPSTLDREFWNFMWGEIHVFRGQGHLRLPLVRSILMMFHMLLCVSVRDGHQNSSLMDHP